MTRSAPPGFDLIVYRSKTLTSGQKALLMPAIDSHYQFVSRLGYGRQQSWCLFVPIR